jgi:CHASE2 domain-containing sensor protein
VPEREPSERPSVPPGSGRRIGIASLAAAVALIALAEVSRRALPLPFLGEEILYDRLVQSRMADAGLPLREVVIVGWTDETEHALTTPFKDVTPHLTRLVRRLAAAGARVIGIDIGLGYLEGKREGQEFFAACKEAGTVVMATELPRADRLPAYLAEDVVQMARRYRPETGFADRVKDGDPEPYRFANRGGVVRIVPLDAPAGGPGGRRIHSFALAIAARYLGVPASGVTITRTECRLGDRSIPLEERTLRVDYPGPERIKVFPLHNVLSDAHTPETLSAICRGRAVLVGGVWRQLADLHLTPFGLIPGVRIHASAVHTLLSGSSVAPLPPACAWLGVLAASVCVGGLFLGLARARALLASLGLGVTLYALVLAAYGAGVWVPAFFALLSCPAVGFLLWGLDLARPAPATAPRFATAIAPTLLSGAGPHAATMAPAASADLVVIVACEAIAPRYLGLRLLGKGGMGVVLAATDTTTGQEVAVKVLSPLLSDQPELMGRFMREVRALRDLDHPGIVRVLDVGGDGGYPYYAMEILEGPHLRQVVAEQGLLPLDRAHGLFRQLFDVLAHVHDRGIVHRDIKPENILVLPGDRLKLLDFGLAHVPEATTLTRDGEIMGTLRYMSPEQMEGTGIGPASDIFSAALVVYECLTGRAPFPELGKVLHHSGTFVPVGAHRTDATRELGGLLSRCLHPVAHHRIASARDVLAAWDAAFRGARAEGAPAPPEPAGAGPDATRARLDT